MVRTLRISALALLAAVVLVVLLNGAALAGTSDRDPSPVLTQVSLTVQPDLCVGYVMVSLSYDGGYHWEPFIEAPVHGNPSNCDVADLGAPYVNQASITWTPTWDDADNEGDAAGVDEGNGRPPEKPYGQYAGEPVAASDVLTLTAGPQAGSTRARLASTMALHPGQPQTYWAQFTWFPGGSGAGSDTAELLFGAAGHSSGPGTSHRRR
jgi:hypothetical protein